MCHKAPEVLTKVVVLRCFAFVEGVLFPRIVAVDAIPWHRRCSLGIRSEAPKVTAPWVDKLPSPWPSVPVNQQLVVDLFSANVGSLPGKDEALRGW